MVPPRPPSRRRVRRWALRACPPLLLAGFALQYVAMTHVGEPYPAIMMPGFGGVPQPSAGGGSVVWEMVGFVEFRNGTRRVYPEADLLAEILGSQKVSARKQLKRSFRVIAASREGGKSRRRDPVPKSYRLSGAERALLPFLPGLRAYRRGLGTDRQNAALAAWLGERAGALYPGRKLAAVGFGVRDVAVEGDVVTPGPPDLVEFRL